MFKISNNTVVDWPNDAMVENDCRDIRQDQKRFGLKLTRNTHAYLNLTLTVPKLCEDQTIKITFFFTSKASGNTFGMPFFVELVIEKSKIQNKSDITQFKSSNLY